MAFDCDSCWKAPCECGKQYEGMTVYQLEKLRKTINDVIRDRVYEDYKKEQSWEGPGNQ